MMEQRKYCKRLIEVDLPIKKISEHARREKDMRRGHVPLMYIWPATRPTAACRAVMCGCLWLDPVDTNCQGSFRSEVKDVINNYILKNLSLLSEYSFQRFFSIQKDPSKLEDNLILRNALLDLIAEFSIPENSINQDYLNISRLITSASLKAIDSSKTKPLVFDTFSGGGAIPMEALRIGADIFAGDLNSVSTMLNKIVLDYVPKFGNKLIEILNDWENWIKQKAFQDLQEYYPIDKNKGTTTAYLWARTIKCEGPNCGAEVPLLRSLWIVKKSGRSLALQLIPNKKEKKVDFAIIEKTKNKKWLLIDQPKGRNKQIEFNSQKVDFSGTIARGSVICPCCSFTTNVKRVRDQLNLRNGGSNDAIMTCVVTVRPNEKGRFYRLSSNEDIKAYEKAKKNYKQDNLLHVPNDPLPPEGALGFRVQKYGMRKWSDLFNCRQLIAINKFIQLTNNYINSKLQDQNNELKDAVSSTIALVLDKLIDNNAALCMWQLNTPNAAHVFGRWALPMVWDYAEVNPISAAGGTATSLAKKVREGISNLIKGNYESGISHNADAASIPLPNDCADLFFTDPPYYDAIGYSDIADFFYVWLKKMPFLENLNLFQENTSAKEDECIVDPVRKKDKEYFKSKMTSALKDARRVLAPSGIGVVVFAHKSTEGWEALLNAMIDAGWVITSSWSIDTEMAFRMRGRDSAALASSIHLVCRPRENLDGSLITDNIGDWRDVLQELPKRIHEWMPRLAEEGIVGADAIFACLGPALEIFSQYSHVEKANGNKVELREYLEQVWAAVAKEALNMIFKEAHTEGFEEDSRLTAMWLWTLSMPANGNSKEKDVNNTERDENGLSKVAISSGFSLEFDAARRIAQGLGAHLESLSNLIEIKGDKARLLPVSERVKSLFGKDSSTGSTYKRRKKEKQLTLFDELKIVQEEDWSLGDTKAEVGKTVLDRLHQAMILFGAGRGEALRRFLVEEGVGKDEHFWRLAQALSALYPSSTDEKRWVDGVLAKKKSFGL